MNLRTQGGSLFSITTSTQEKNIWGSQLPITRDRARDWQCSPHRPRQNSSDHWAALKLTRPWKPWPAAPQPALWSRLPDASSVFSFPNSQSLYLDGCWRLVSRNLLDWSLGPLVFLPTWQESLLPWVCPSGHTESPLQSSEMESNSARHTDCSSKPCGAH